ncbi:hypothetical protein HaLaN_15285, partial [Haematococcus lacustris]
MSLAWTGLGCRPDQMLHSHCSMYTLVYAGQTSQRHDVALSAATMPALPALTQLAKPRTSPRHSPTPTMQVGSPALQRQRLTCNTYGRARGGC